MIVGIVNAQGRLKKIIGRQDLDLMRMMTGTADKRTGVRDNLEVVMANLKITITRKDYEAMRKFFG
jgi:hypothetical protein